MSSANHHINRVGQVRYLRPLIIWGLVIVGVVSLIPFILATFWAPSCASCHADQHKQMTQGYHSKLTCEQCHSGQKYSEKLGLRTIVWYQMVLPFGSVNQGVAESVTTQTCLKCHEGRDKTGRLVHRGIIINHTECVKNLECVSCHAGVGHKPKVVVRVGYTMNSCLRCHSEQGVAAEGGCGVCHDGESAKYRNKATTSFSITHGKDWKKTHGMGDPKTCKSCHTDSDCVRCHGGGVPHERGFFSQHSGWAMEANAKCEMCHSKKTFCDVCHGTQMPHPSGYVKVHSAIVKKSSDRSCYNCHKKSDCTSCHSTHIHPGGAKL